MQRSAQQQFLHHQTHHQMPKGWVGTTTAFIVSLLFVLVKNIVSAVDCNLPSNGTHVVTISCITKKTVIPNQHLFLSGQSIVQTVITAKDHSFHIFEVPDSSTLIVKDLTLSGGDAMPNNWGVVTGLNLVKVSSQATLFQATNVKFMHGLGLLGGAIKSNKNTHLNSCVFYRNVAAHGGAISGSVQATSCIFQENRAHIGGALFHGRNAKMFINSSTFDKNAALYQGGVVYADTHQGGFGQTPLERGVQLYLHNVTLKDNSSPLGGVGYLSGFDTGLIVTKSIFLRNKATNKGGVFFSSGQIQIKKSKIIDSSCTVADSIIPNDAGQGGALFIADGTVDLDDVLIKGSSVTGRGGAIYTRPGTSLSISKSIFTDNTAADGSFIFNEGALRIRSSSILQNRINPSKLKAPVFLASCRASTPCKLGGTDCNMDGDCEQGLICFQRFGDPTKKYRVPGVELMNPAKISCSSTNPCSYGAFCNKQTQLCDLIPYNYGVCALDAENFASALCSRTAAAGNIVWIVNTTFENNHFLSNSSLGNDLNGDITIMEVADAGAVLSNDNYKLNSKCEKNGAAIDLCIDLGFKNGCQTRKNGDPIGKNVRCNCSPGRYHSSSLFGKYEQVCAQCIPGTFGNVSGLVGSCHSCFPGQVQKQYGSVFCQDCKAGTFSNAFGSSTCKKCLVGLYQDVPGSNTCVECPSGYFNEMNESTGCTSIPPGFYILNGIKKKCKRGHTCGGQNVQPVPCSKGTYTNTTGSITCISCSPGKFSDTIGAFDCKFCLRGYFQPEPGQSNCNEVQMGQIVAKGGSVSVVVPDGSRINSLDPSGFTACPEGTVGNVPPDELCQKCVAGKSSTKGATKCFSCEKGKFNSKPGSKCQNCKPGKFQDQNTLPSLECVDCPAGWKQTKNGSSSCISLNWKTSGSCKETEYLNDTSLFPSQWECSPCPIGGDCSLHVTWENIRPKFGWWKIPIRERDPNSNAMFAMCIYPPACLGGPNNKLEGIYFDEKGKDLAQLSAMKNETCSIALGFRNTSRLCHTCATGNRRLGAAECAKCPKNDVDNWGFIVLGSLVIFLVLAYVVKSTIDSAGKQDISESVQKIFLNYLQVISLCSRFPLKWPPALKGLFAFQGYISTLGEHLVNPDCIATTSTSAELYYSKVLTFALMPIFIVMIAFLFWYVMGIYKNKPFFKKRLTPTSNTYKDAFVVTISSVLYLMYPALVGNAFSLFDCKKVGAIRYLRVDLNEECFVGRHMSMTVALGLSQLTVYVFGLPLVVLLFLFKNKDNLQEYVSLSRYGLFYGAYKKNRFFWEIVISARKVAVVFLGVFGSSIGPEEQAQIASLTLVICVVLEMLGNPVATPTSRHHFLRWLELSSLLVQWLTMWSGSMLYGLGPNEISFKIFLTFAVVLVNGILMLWFVFCIIKESLNERKQRKLREQQRQHELTGTVQQFGIKEGKSAPTATTTRSRFESIGVEKCVNPCMNRDLVQIIEMSSMSREISP
jgi:hypothetical protein